MRSQKIPAVTIMPQKKPVSLMFEQNNGPLNVSLHWLLRDPTITVMCPCSPWTYATLKYIRSSSSSSMA